MDTKRRNQEQQEKRAFGIENIISENSKKNFFKLEVKIKAHMYTCGGFMSIYGKNHYNIVK